MRERIVSLAECGMGPSEIARTLDSEGVKPPRRDTWHPSTVSWVLAQAALEKAGNAGISVDPELHARLEQFARSEGGELTLESFAKRGIAAGLPSLSVIQKRYGDPRRLCSAAGIEYRDRRRQSAPRLEHEELRRRLQAFAIAEGGEVTVTALEERGAAAGLPSPSVIQREYGGPTALCESLGVRFASQRPTRIGEETLIHHILAICAQLGCAPGALTSGMYDRVRRAAIREQEAVAVLPSSSVIRKRFGSWANAMHHAEQGIGHATA